MRFQPASDCPAANDTLHELELVLDGIVSAEKARISIERLVDQLVENLEEPIGDLESQLEDFQAEAVTANESVASYQKENDRLNGVLDTLEAANLQLIANTDEKAVQIRALEESNLHLHQKCVRLARELREMAEKYEGSNV